MFSRSGIMKLTLLLLLFLVVTAALAKVEVNENDDDYETIEVRQEGGQPDTDSTVLQNPCNTHTCKRGEMCVLENRKPRCQCQTCEPVANKDSMLQVCSTTGVTYDSECELDRDHCLCQRAEPGCRDSSSNKVRLDYYHACKELTPCPAEELEAFPGRMRDWLYRVMNDMAMRGYEELDEYRDLLENARHDEKHADAVIWKFCDLDVHPDDRHVTRRELMYIIASVKPMEHCLVPFLNQCDADDDGTITLVEWGTCLKIGHEAIVDKCKHVSSKA